MIKPLHFSLFTPTHTLRFAAALSALGGALTLAGCGAPATSSNTSTSQAPTTGNSAMASTDTTSGDATSGDTTSGDTVKVGILHSLSGTMSISEVSVKNADLLAIKEINAAGGVLGKKIVPVVEDGASDWPTFAQKAEKLLTQDKVAATFGCWTSSSRKAVKPVFEKNKGLLYYPVQYEGLESSPYIFYTGATTNQQIVPAVSYLLKTGKKKMFLLGSDYVFPRTANKVIKAQLAAEGGTVAGEEYTPLGHTEYSTVISKIKAAKPDVVFSSLNGDSNVAFFKQLKAAGMDAKSMPVMSVSVAEEEVKGIGAANIVGQMASWNYYETTKTPGNPKFVKAFKAEYGQDAVTSDPVDAAYSSVYLWKASVEKAKSFDVEAVKKAAPGVTFDAPGGTYKIDGDNQHIYKKVRIGVVQPDGMFKEVWSTPDYVKPDPYLKTYVWGKGLGGT
ncbi:urea-binding protein [Abditibacterium utsteinense]|uniref:Urea-binding protein n=1 Tax=Abditibacterium utsteinense TaxID=1960156 RepID=A0A2S8SWM5_9BACT|nr:urea ABC transporter substrate-binding protein [Abditibacterium utsteinense]PQV65193.1 urea-binding protein [Abditibacterium utsteinense]